MKCVICQYGETEPGTTTVTLTRDETTIVIRDVPAQICTTCGEEYVDAVAGKRLSQIAEPRSSMSRWLLRLALVPSVSQQARPARAQSVQLAAIYP